MSENKNNSGIVKAEENTPVMPFSNTESFERALRMAKVLSSSTLVPPQYQGEKGVPNCVIALEMAPRIGMSPFFVMQNMHVIQGRPSWSATYLIGVINTSGKFSPLRFRIEHEGRKKVEYTPYVWINGKKQPEKGTAEIEEITCVAYATELATGDILESPTVSISMAVKEGWYTKDGSKWQTMPELMLRYRAAAFFSRMYCPEVAMGLHTVEEVSDVYDESPTPVQASTDAKERAKNLTTALLAEAEEPSTVVEAELLPPQDEPASQKEEPMPKTRSKPTMAESRRQRLFNFLKGPAPDGLRLNDDQCKKFISDALDRKVESTKDLTVSEINIIEIAANDALLQRKGAA